MFTVNEFYRGTSAYKLEQYESYSRRNRENTEERARQRKQEQLLLCKYMILAVTVLFIACSSLVYVNVMAMRAATEIETLKKDLALVIDQNKQKEIKINQNLDMKVIEKKAIEKLGMQKPDNSQIVYINVRKGSHSEAINPGKKVKSGESKIKEFLNGIVDYFS